MESSCTPKLKHLRELDTDAAFHLDAKFALDTTCMAQAWLDANETRV